MRYEILAISSLKRSFYQEACQYYLERLQVFGKTEMVELKPSKATTREKIQQQESQALLQQASGYLIALDESGKQFRSLALANWITDLESQGISKLSLMIGGAEGHAESLLEASRLVWSLSSLTLAHELARLVLLEQLYRAETLRTGHPYHRE